MASSSVLLEPYAGEAQLPHFLPLIAKDLSEPYSVWTYRYFLHGWPQLCFLAWDPKPPPAAASAVAATGAEGADSVPATATTAHSISAAANATTVDIVATVAEKAQPSGGSVDDLRDEKGRRCIGIVIAKLDRHKRGALRGYVAMLAVHESYRKLGLATRLVSRCVNAMAAELCEEVVLETEVTNKGAQALYQSLGFLREKRLVRYYMNGGDAFRLRLTIVQEQDLENMRSEQEIERRRQEAVVAEQQLSRAELEEKARRLRDARAQSGRRRR